MHDWIDRHLWFALSVIGGIIVSVLTADNQSLPVAAARVFCGLFCAVFFTDPLLDALGRDPAVYRNAMAGLLAVSGYAAVRMLNQMKWERLVDIVKAWRKS
jgi:hypothetical protein